MFGLFLDQAFHESLKVCGECGETYLDHYKSYVHGKAKVDLIIEKYDIQCLNNGEMQGKTKESCGVIVRNVIMKHQLLP